jgi:hypothetical protein
MELRWSRLLRLLRLHAIHRRPHLSSIHKRRYGILLLLTLIRNLVLRHGRRGDLLLLLTSLILSSLFLRRKRFQMIDDILFPSIFHLEPRKRLSGVSQQPARML